MTDPRPPDEAQDVTQLLTLTRRGMGLAEELLAVLRENERGILLLIERIQILEQLTREDPLTGLINRRGFDEALLREEARAQRDRTAAAVIVLDVRGLRAVNNSHGHAAGDALLRTVATALRQAARGSDLVARSGGDEFAVLLPGAQQTGATRFLERVRGAAQSFSLPEGTAIPVELSAGLATRDESGSLNAALELADQRLLAEKGRRP